MSKKLRDNFNVRIKQPIDTRFAVSQLSDIDLPYEGLKTYQKSDKKYYKFEDGMFKADKTEMMINVKDYNLKGDGLTDDYFALNDLITLVGTTETDIYFPNGNYIIGSNITLPLNINLIFSKGAMLTISSTKTLTVNSSVNAGLWQIFNGTLSGTLNNHTVFGEWFGMNESNADNSIAINKAISLCNSTLMITKGIYKLTSPVILNKSLKICGFQGGENASVLKGMVAGVDLLQVQHTECVIDGLMFTYDVYSSESACAISIFDGCGYQNISNCSFVLTPIAIKVKHASNTKIINTTGVRIPLTMFWIENTNDVLISKFMVDNNGADLYGLGSALYLKDWCEAIIVTDGDLIGGKYALYTDATNYAVNSRPAYNRFTNVYFDSATLGSSINKMVLTDFIGCWFSNRPSDGANVTSCDTIRFIACQFINNGGHGCYVSNNSSNITFDNCDFIANSSSSPGTKHGVAIDPNTNNFSIINCRASNGLGFQGTQAYGIFVNTGTSDNYIIQFNRLTGNATGGLSDNGTGVNKFVANNI